MDDLQRYEAAERPLRRDDLPPLRAQRARCCPRSRSACGTTSATTSRSSASARSCAGRSTSASPTSTWPTTTARRTAAPRPTSGRIFAAGLPALPRRAGASRPRPATTCGPGRTATWGSRKYLLAEPRPVLARMGLDYVDIFYSHRFDPETPLEETMGALDTAVRSGRALYAGISSYSPERTREAAAILRAMGTPLLIHQPSLLDAQPLGRAAGLLDVLGEEGIGCIAFSPLAQGMLTDRYLDGIPEGSRAAQGKSLDPSLLERRERSRTSARSTRSPAAAARPWPSSRCAWVLRDERVTSVLDRRQQRRASSRTNVGRARTARRSPTTSSPRSTSTPSTPASTCGSSRACHDGRGTMRALVLDGSAPARRCARCPSRRARPTARSCGSRRPGCAAATGTAGWATTRDIALPARARARARRRRRTRSGRGVARLAAGDRVTVPFVCACGQLPAVPGRRPAGVRAPDASPGSPHWGSFAELVALDHADVNLVALPDGVDAVAAAALGCRFATAFRAVAAGAGCAPGEWVAVHGCGGVGPVGRDDRRGGRRAGGRRRRLGRRRWSWPAAGAAPSPWTRPAARDVAGRVREADRRRRARCPSTRSAAPATCAASIARLRRAAGTSRSACCPPRSAGPSVPMDRVIAGELEMLGSHGMAAHALPASCSRWWRRPAAPGRPGHPPDPARRRGRRRSPRWATRPPAGITVALP